jgi:DNA helicase-2/ATP-dependent DNA helicase PcrA
MKFTQAFPKPKKIVLNHNYRSTQKILNCAYRLIQNNNPDRLEITEKINKKLISLMQVTIPSLKFSPINFAEAAWIAKNIKLKVDSCNVDII